MSKYKPENDSPLSNDESWQMRVEEPLADAVRDALDQDLPKRDPVLKDLLSERLLNESKLATQGGAESKVALADSKSEAVNKTDWKRWVGWTSVAAAACVFVGAILWVQNDVAREASAPLVMSTGAPNPSLGGGLPSTSVTEADPGTNQAESSRAQVQQQFSPVLEAQERTIGLNGQLQPKAGNPPVVYNVVPAQQPTAPATQQNWELTPQFTPQAANSGATLYSFYSQPSNGPILYKGRAVQRELLTQAGQQGQRGLSLGFRPYIESYGEGETSHNEVFDFYGGAADPLIKYDESISGEQYNQIIENAFLPTKGELALSTFSIDVDTASYSNMRRFINSGQIPPPNSVRIEELVNYFEYDYPQPEGDDPFSVNMEVAPCPWNPAHRLLRVALKGKEIDRDQRPVSNLVFLVDVSGSMTSADKLPLLKRGLQLMVDHLGENDRVSIVTYAGNAGVVLEPTSGDQKRKINEAIERLTSGGSTHGSAGIEKAYDLAVANLIDGGTNRVIWATDGDLNVGITDDQTLINLVSERAQEGVFLTTLGFGTGNLKDGKLEQIANNGNGMYAYIDTFKEAHKVLVQQMSGSLVTIAKDVKLQIEFNPGEVAGYRLIGYENRVLANEDFDNDVIDAGEIGAGHTVTAIYELVPSKPVAAAAQPETKLKYQTAAQRDAEVKDPPEDSVKEPAAEARHPGELLTLALRYKQPEASESKRIEFIFNEKDARKMFDEASADFRFTASVASFGMMLRRSKFRGQTSLDWIEQTAAASLGEDQDGYRAEFIDLVRRAKTMIR